MFGFLGVSAAEKLPTAIKAEDVEKWITWEDPPAKFFCGIDETKLGIGNYGCGYGGCKQGAPDDCVYAMWVPPNKYVYAYTDFQPNGSAGVQVGNYNKIGEGSFTLTEDELINSEFCQNKGYVHITKADYSCADGSKGLNSVLGRARNIWEGCTGDDCSKFGGSDSMNSAWGDSCPGHTKRLSVDFECMDRASVVSRNEPDTIMGPGWYPNTETTGTYTSLIPTSVPFYNKRGKGMSINKMDTHVVAEIKPWKDHLRECCFSGIENGLCGKFSKKNMDGSPNTEQGANCSGFLDECTIEDIKTQSDGKEGKCQFICRQRPELCDNMKNKYCRENPESSWCDCIKAEERKEYKDKKTLADEFGVSVPSKVCLLSRCTSGQDLEDIFITSDLIPDIRNSNQCPGPKVFQKIDVSGSDNVLNLQQNVDATFGAEDHTTTSQEVDVSGTDIVGDAEQSQKIDTSIKKEKKTSDDIKIIDNTKLKKTDLTTGDKKRDSSIETNYTWLYLFLGFLGFVIFGFIIAFLISGKKNDTAQPYQQYTQQQYIQQQYPQQYPQQHYGY